jgi:hypothetical protein
MGIIYSSGSGFSERIDIARPDYSLDTGRNGGLAFTALSGLGTNYDTGFFSPFSVGQFYMAGNLYTQAYLNTNGIVSFGGGTTSQTVTNSLQIAGNSGNQWLQPGRSMSPPSPYLQGAWVANTTLSIDGTTCYRCVIIANMGQRTNITNPTGYTMSLWRWGSRQFITVRLRYRAVGSNLSSGPLGALQTPSSTTNHVWTSVNNGVSWSYLGSGDVGVTGPALPQTNASVEDLVNNSYYITSDWNDALRVPSQAATRSIAMNGLACTPRLQININNKIAGFFVQQPLNTILTQIDPTTGQLYGKFRGGTGALNADDSWAAGQICRLPNEGSPILAATRTAAARLGQRLRDVNYQLAAANQQIWVMGQGNMKRKYTSNNYGTYSASSSGTYGGGFIIWQWNSSGSATWPGSPMWSKGWNGASIAAATGPFYVANTNNYFDQPWLTADSTNGGPGLNQMSDWVNHASCQGGICSYGYNVSTGTWVPQGLWV